MGLKFSPASAFNGQGHMKRFQHLLLIAVLVVAASCSGIFASQTAAASEVGTEQVVASGYAPMGANGCYNASDYHNTYFGGASTTLYVNWCVSGSQITSASSSIAPWSSNPAIYYVYSGPSGWRDTPVPTYAATTAYWTTGWDSMNSSGVCYIHQAIRSYPSGYWEVVEHYLSGQCDY